MPAYSELVDVIGQQSGMPDVAEKAFGASLCVGWLWLRGGDVRVIEHVAHMQMMHAYSHDAKYPIRGDQWPWNMIMLEMDLAFANLEQVRSVFAGWWRLIPISNVMNSSFFVSSLRSSQGAEIGPFVGVATRGSAERQATDSGEGGAITRMAMRSLGSQAVLPYDVFYQSEEAKRDINFNTYFGLRVMNLNGRVISRSRCQDFMEVRQPAPTHPTHSLSYR